MRKRNRTKRDSPAIVSPMYEVETIATALGKEILVVLETKNGDPVLVVFYPLVKEYFPPFIDNYDYGEAFERYLRKVWKGRPIFRYLVDEIPKDRVSLLYTASEKLLENNPEIKTLGEFA